MGMVLQGADPPSRWPGWQLPFTCLLDVVPLSCCFGFAMEHRARLGGPLWGLSMVVTRRCLVLLYFTFHGYLASCAMVQLRTAETPIVQHLVEALVLTSCRMD